MSRVIIKGNQFLNGTVKINGSKNAAIPLICASLLAKGKVLLKNVPRISDVFCLIEILKKIDCLVVFKGHSLFIDNINLKYKPLLFEECRKIRGSYYFIGVFLTIFSRCEILLPGGCNIGARPIDLHLKAFNDLGYSWEIKNDVLNIIKKEEYKEGSLFFSKKSVGASLNALFASLSLEKVTMQNCLFEPEGKDVITFLNKIGYKISFSNNELFYFKEEIKEKDIKHKVIFDRIEAMTYTVMGLLTGRLKIKNVETKYLEVPLTILKDSGYIINYDEKEIEVYKSRGSGFKIVTEEYPGFPTDLQAIYGILGVFSYGKTIIKENIFENRLGLYKELLQMGVDITINGNVVDIVGVEKLKSASMNASDLRNGAALILLALKMNGESEILNYELVERGYENLIETINVLGGNVKKYKI